MEMKFLADTMLGSLARWLRVMGWDTHYQRYYPKGVLVQLLLEGRKLLSRHRKMVRLQPDGVLILSDHLHEQILQLKELGLLCSDRSLWFTRCLECNVLLEEAHPHEAKVHVPDHVFHQTVTGIRYCPSCKRYYWQGSHREKMTWQLREWGF